MNFMHTCSRYLHVCTLDWGFTYMYNRSRYLKVCTPNPGINKYASYRVYFWYKLSSKCKVSNSNSLVKFQFLNTVWMAKRKSLQTIILKVLTYRQVATANMPRPMESLNTWKEYLRVQRISLQPWARLRLITCQPIRLFV